MSDAPNFLSVAQLAAWKRDGFLVLENFAHAATCARLRTRAAEWTDRLKAEQDQAVFTTHDQAKTSNAYFLESGDKIRIFMEEHGPRVPNKLGHALHDLDPVFAEFSRQPALAAIARDIGLRTPHLMQSMYIFKHPRQGGEVAAHQDSAFLYTEPLSVVGFWFAMQAATIDNACLWAVPGGHHAPLRRRFHRDGQGGTTFEQRDPRPLPTEGYIPLEVPEGSLILLHGQLPHKSEANRSAHPREAYTLHIVEGEAVYPADNWLQRRPDFPATGFS